MAGSVAKRTDGRWRARYRDPSGRERARHFRRKVDALAWLDQIGGSLATGKYVDPRGGQMTLGQWVSDRWLPSLDIGAKTRESWEERLHSLVLPALGDVRLENLTHDAIRTWAVTMTTPKGAAAGWVRRCDAVRVLARVLDDAQESELITRNPARTVRGRLPLPKRPEEELDKPRAEKVLAWHQIARVADAQTDQYGTITLLCGRLGLRLGEVTALRVGDVDVEARTLQVRQAFTRLASGPALKRTKNGRERTIPLPVRLLGERLRSAMDGKDIQDLLFATAAGSPLRQENVRRSFSRALVDAQSAVATLENALGLPSTGNFDRAVSRALPSYQKLRGIPATGVTDVATWVALGRGRGVQWGMTLKRLRAIELRPGDADWTQRISPHGLRHSAATRMLEEGIPIAHVAAVLGHEDQTVTAKVYSHVRPSTLHGLADLLDVGDLKAPISGSADFLRTFAPIGPR